MGDLFASDTYIRATSRAPKRQARRGSQLVLKNLLTFLFYNGRASAMPPKGQSRVFSKLGHKEGKELVVEST